MSTLAETSDVKQHDTFYGSRRAEMEHVELELVTIGNEVGYSLGKWYHLLIPA